MDSRDAIARRRVADQVKAVTADGADRFGAVVADQVAAVYRAASDGRDPAVACDRKAIDDAFSEAATAASAVVLASDLRAPDGGLGISGRTHYVSPNRRQGWRARLANVERLLAIAVEGGGPVRAADDGEVAAALAEVRAMIDGAE
jgi:hypothetical protein